jgi:hypothetical protein
VKQILHAALAGLLAFAAAESGWLILRRFAGDSSRWVLEPITGLLLAGTILFFALVWLGARAGQPQPGITKGAFAAYGGVCVSITIFLFVVGAGNVWPIVLVIDYVIAAVFVAAGWGVGRLIVRLRGVSS